MNINFFKDAIAVLKGTEVDPNVYGIVKFKVSLTSIFLLWFNV